VDGLVRREKTDASQILPDCIPNWIGGEEVSAQEGGVFEKRSPHNGEHICVVAKSSATDVDRAVTAAKRAQPGWAETPAVRRGSTLHAVCNALEEHQEAMARVVALETGKSFKEAMGETAGAISLGRFFAGEGQRLYGRTTTSGIPNRYAMTVRQPCGVAALITAANTPIANVAWKVFPALICGNGVVLKAAEDTPATAWLFTKIAHESGMYPGALNVIQGLGPEAGAPLVLHPGVDVISFTGSTITGRWVGEQAAKRMAKASLELGGKNPFIVCDDADLGKAAKWACLSAFSNAGQRCAAGSRIIIFERVYEQFRDMLVTATAKLKVGPGDDDDLGPVINERQLKNMLAVVERAREQGVRILVGGVRMTDEAHVRGYYMSPTLIEGAAPESEISTCELFGPIATLYRVRDFEEALKLANDSPYGLTACIHTRNLDRAIEFVHRIEAGVAVVNAGTYGSEPHMPFGGLKQSGNGSREPGTEALDVYTELKTIYLHSDYAEGAAQQ
jgi:acyl-CoA reductase-like NAD-dependent aldehyde dehydrogenase